MTDGKTIHLRYAIGILTALLIGSLSVQWNHVSGLADIVSFGLSFASLILALIAIFQALNSSTSFTTVVSSLERSASDIRESASAIQSTADQVISTTESHTSVLSDVRETLINKLTTVETNDKQSDRLSDRPTLSKGITKNTFGGHLSTYIVARAATSSKPVTGNLIFTAKNRLFGNYFEGYAAAALFLNLIKGHVDEKGRYLITDLGEDADALAKEAKRILTTKSKQKEKAKELLALVDNFFDEQDSDEAPAAP
jgi:hypothetical protein